MTRNQIMMAARREGEIAAERLVHDLDLPEGRAVDIFGVIEQQEIWLFFQELRSLWGVYLPGPPAGILINSGRPVGAQRLTAAHELGHHILRHGEGVDDDISLRAAPGQRTGLAKRVPFETYVKEIAAQAFAMSFLAPATLVRDMMTSLDIPRGGDQSPERIYELSLHLGMSYEATVHRLVSLRELAVSHIERLLVPPAMAKKSIGHGHKPQDSRADVWPISSRQMGTLINARVGDELALSLDELPSSGYRWVLEQDDNAIVVRRDEFVASSGDGSSVCTGVGGQRHITVRVVRPGENRIRLSCQRPWRAHAPLTHFYFMVDAEEMPGKERAPRLSIRQASLQAVQ